MRCCISSFILEQWLRTRSDFALPNTFAMFGDTFGFQNWWERLALVSEVVATDAPKHLAVPRISPATENYLVPTANSAKVVNPGLE